MHEGPIAGVILAAGAAERFGRPKQLAPLGGKCLLAWPVDAALASVLDRVVLVLGHAAEEITTALGDRLAHPKITPAFNRRWRSGQSASLVCGLRAAGGDCAAVMFLLGDQPLVDARLIDRLIAAFRGSPRGICAPVHGGRRGNPVIFDRRYYPRLAAVKGDRGARGLIAANPDDVLEVPAGGQCPFCDVDTPGDLARLAGRLGAGGRQDGR